jgi:hypothetical protein
MMWYPASKKFAELAAFEVQKKTGNTFTLGTVCPPRKSFRSCYYAQY